MAIEISWTIIVNLKTCKPRRWKAWQNLLHANGISFSLHLTKSISELSDILHHQLSLGQRHFLFIGGDGTLHHGGNLLLHHAGEKSNEIIIGLLPCGTGNDWIRTYGISQNEIIESLILKRSAPLQVLKLQWPDGSTRYAFNMVGGALDAAVVEYLDVNKFQFAGFLKYPLGLLATLMKPHKWNAILKVDGQQIEGPLLTIQAGFGKYCGGGMFVLPHAGNDQAGLLIMRPKSLMRLLTSLPKLYNSKIAHQKEAIAMHFSTLEINHTGEKIPLEADGEFLGYTPVTITAMKGIMNRLI